LSLLDKINVRLYTEIYIKL